ncbi:MAG: hypothetical protein GY749_03755 [Desulfobacteraceae bacterium]|nr:hypothetical protein [Desulfobacteraceae bacterium]
MNLGTDILVKIMNKAKSMTVKDYEELFNDSEQLENIDIADIEIARDDLDPAHCFKPGAKHVVWSPYDEHKAAYQLQQLLNEHQQPEMTTIAHYEELENNEI